MMCYHDKIYYHSSLLEGIVIITDSFY